MSYVSTQRERLRVLLQAFDREAFNLASAEPSPAPSMAREKSTDAGLSKSRSEADFDKIEKEELLAAKTAQGSWMPWNWGAKAQEEGKSSGVDLGS